MARRLPPTSMIILITLERQSRQVLKLCSQVRDGELALSPSVASDPEVAAILKARGIEPVIEFVDNLGLPYVAHMTVTI